MRSLRAIAACFAVAWASIAEPFIATSFIAITSIATPLLAQPMSLVIGIDGLGYGERGLEETNTPNINALFDGSWADGYRGSFTNQAFAGGVRGEETQQPTVSGPGWSTMLTGVWADRHGVTDNGFGGRNYQANPTYLEIVEESLPDVVSGSFINWDPIDTFIISSVDDDNSQMDVRADLVSDVATANTAANFLRELSPGLPASVFVALDDVDLAGHQCGSSGQCYQNAVTLADIYVGRMLRRITERDSFSLEDWQIIVTADHGHRPSGGHGGQSTLERQIPFVVSNRRVDPGQIQPNADTPVSHADVAPTVLEHFGIPIPEYFWGASRANGSAPFMTDGDFDGDGLLGIADIDLLSAQAAAGDNEPRFDLTGDDVVDFADINFWVSDLANTWTGDSNVDLEFNSNDLVTVFQSSRYETGQAATWSSGDWNGDGLFGSSDLVSAFQDGGYEKGPRIAGHAVPESSYGLAIVAGLLCLVVRYR